MEKSKKLAELDFFRALAVILVFFYHFYAVIGENKISSGVKFLDILCQTGGIGIDLFFILSGFLLAYSIYLSKERGKFSLKKYFKRRFSRIVPAYYFALIISLIITPIYFTSALGLQNIGTHLLFIHNFWRDFHGGILGVAWTLGIEMQFYFLVPIFISLFFKSFRSVCFFLIFTLIATWGYRFFLFENYYAHWDTWNKFIFTDQLIGRMDQFALGIFSAFLFLRKPTLIYKSKKASTVIFFLFCGFFYLWVNHYYHLGSHFWDYKKEVVGSHTILGIIFSILILTSFNLISFFHKIFSKRIFFHMASLSYSVYLWHLIVMNQLKILSLGIFPQLMISLILTFLLAFVSYNYIEKPFLKK